MTIFFIILMCVMLYGVKFAKKGEYFDDYIGIEQTAAINGVFTVIVFMFHTYTRYKHPGNWFDLSFKDIHTTVSQFCVAPFLFYSGYGMMESIKKKGQAYVKSIPSRRLFSVWYHFAIAVTIYLILSYIIKPYYPIGRILLAYIGLKSIGNSNWYMFVTFIMYIIIYVSFIISKEKKWLGATLVFVFAIIAAIIEKQCKLDGVFYTTILCMPMGIVYSLNKERFFKFFTKNAYIYYGSIVLFLVLAHICNMNRFAHEIVYNLYVILGMLALIIITMKVKIGNKALTFFSKHVFSMYILQRIPLMIFRELGLHKLPYLFIIVCFVTTILLAVGFDALCKKTDSLIYKKKKS